DLAIVGECGIAGEDEHVAGTAHFVARVFLADAALGGDEVGDLFGARADRFGGTVADAVAIVPRELRAEGARDRERPTHVFDAALRHRADQRARVRIADLEHALAADGRARDAHLLVQHASGADVREVGHHVHVKRFKARSKASKLRQRCADGSAVARALAKRGTRCSERPPCERKGASSPERSWRARALPRTVSRSETITRSPMRSAGNSNRALAASRERTSSTPGSAAMRFVASSSRSAGTSA